MKKLLSTLFCSLYLFSSTLAYAQVEYFGFWGDAMNGVGNGNYIDETAAVSNLHFISSNTDSDQFDGLIAKVKQAKSKGNRSVLMLESFFFEWASVNLATSRELRLNKLKVALKDYESSIFGIYIIDEPYWKNSLSAKKISNEEVGRNLQEAARLARRFFPNAVVITTEASPMLTQPQISFPAEIDWIGVNCYVYYRECRNKAELETLYNNLLGILKHNQQMVLTLDGHWNGRKGINYDDIQNKIVARNNLILSIAHRYPIVAFFPFLYQSDNSGHEDLVGTNELPKVKAQLFDLGKRIRAGETVICKTLAPTCEGRDYVRRDSCGMELERWKNAPPPYCPAGGVTTPVPTPTPTPPPVTCTVMEPKCEGRDYVRRDSCGKEIERWKNAPPPYCPVGGVTTPSPTPTPPPVTCTVMEPKCEGRDYVRRDSCGKEIERWKNAPKPYCN